MSQLANSLQARFYRAESHPYRIFERRIEDLLKPGDALLDAGCGRSVPVLRGYVGKARRLVGVEAVEFTDVPPEIEAIRCDLSRIPIEDGCIDLIMSRSVFEHLTEPEVVYREVARILRPGGRIVFLTANMWDYGTFVARIVPNQYHGRVVRHVEGRAEMDTFPTAYKTNTRSAITELANQSGLVLEDFQYLNQYPNYFMFNGALFLVGVAYERLTSKFESLAWLRGWIMATLKKP